MRSRESDPKKLLPGVVIVPSGVAELARLPAREGYVYGKPIFPPHRIGAFVRTRGKRRAFRAVVTRDVCRAALEV